MSHFLVETFTADGGTLRVETALTKASAIEQAKDALAAHDGHAHSKVYRISNDGVRTLVHVGAITGALEYDGVDV